MTDIRRLIVCLDGTWNNRDDSTNVLHHFGLTKECRDSKVDGNRVTQLKFYLEGVGTGPLDSITGGGFGFGLETNVRAAYNWLVQNYEDETAFTPADEIYIFGFSRGAFTARSLVGFISTCGLLRRGAPLTVNELWRTYCLLGRAREHHSGPLTDLFPDPPLRFRRITDLIWDPWLIRQKEAASPHAEGQVPGQRAAKLTPTEALLVCCSRRVKITYLGVYDTVGAVGWDALAIPGIRSRLALHHNMRPTTLIQRCRHALAIDEHRSSFKHTPFVAYISGDTAAGELKRIEGDFTARKEAQVDAVGALASAWTRKIEQRWFVGAHSNVGGGYESNPLAQQPLVWLLDGAREAGLVCDRFSNPAPPDKQLGPRDSFIEFAPPYWTTMLRAKRTYRVIDPDPEIRAERRQRKESSAFMLVNINEQVDPNAIAYWANQKDVAPPPNLVEYARRKKARGNDLTTLAGRRPRHPWMGNGFVPYIMLALWATLAAGGVLAVDLVFRIWIQEWPPVIWLAFAAAGFALVDWAESCQNFTMALRGVSPARRAFLDSIYWTRTLCVGLFAFGLIGGIASLVVAGTSANTLTEALANAWWLMRYFGLVSLGAGLGVGLGVVFNHLYAKASTPRASVVIVAAIVSPLVIAAIIPIGIVTMFQVWRIVQPALGVAAPTAANAPAPYAQFAGLLLLLQLSLIYFVNALTWAGEPMAKARLGSIVPLQMCFTPGQIKACLDRWCTMLRGHAAARCAMSAVVREALYRDIIGFIPVYSGVFAFGLFFGFSQLGWSWLATLWYVLPLTALLADYAEDVIHLKCLRLHQKAKTPSISLALVGGVMTWVKLAGFIGEGVLTLVIVGAATLRIFEAPVGYGWRGLIALAISLFAGLILGGLTVGWLVYRAITGKAQRQASVSADSRSLSLSESTGDSRG
jgi:uncharacterized protein (DUF2235 family)